MARDIEEATRRMKERVLGYQDSAPIVDYYQSSRPEAPKSLVSGNQPQVGIGISRPEGGTVGTTFDPRIQGAARKAVMDPLRAVQEANVAGSMASEEMDPDFGAVSIQPPHIKELIARAQRFQIQKDVEGPFPGSLTGTPELRGEVQAQLSDQEMLRRRAGAEASTMKLAQTASPEFRDMAERADVDRLIRYRMDPKAVGGTVSQGADITLASRAATGGEIEAARPSAEDALTGEENVQRKLAEAQAMRERLLARAAERDRRGAQGRGAMTASEMVKKAIADGKARQDKDAAAIKAADKAAEAAAAMKTFREKAEITQGFDIQAEDRRAAAAEKKAVAGRAQKLEDAKVSGSNKDILEINGEVHSMLSKAIEEERVASGAFDATYEATLARLREEGKLTEHSTWQAKEREYAKERARLRNARNKARVLVRSRIDEYVTSGGVAPEQIGDSGSYRFPDPRDNDAVLRQVYGKRGKPTTRPAAPSAGEDGAPKLPKLVTSFMKGTTRPASKGHAQEIVDAIREVRHTLTRAQKMQLDPMLDDLATKYGVRFK